MLLARTRVLVAAASAALALTLPAAARAADPPLAQQLANVPIEVSPEQFRTNLLVSADFARLSRADGTTDLVLERVLQRLYAGNPGLAAADAAARIQALRTAAAPQEPSSTAWAQAGGDGRILAVLAALKQAAPAGPTETAVAQLARTALRETADTAGVRSAEGRFAAAAAAPDTLRMNGSFNPAAVLESSAALAARSAAFAQARDMLWRAASGVSLRWSTAELLARTPALADNPGVQRIAGLRDVDGALRVNAGAIIGDPRAPGANTLEHVFDDMEAEQADAVADAVERANGTPLDAARLQARQARTEAWTAAAVLETQSLEAPQALTFATDATTAVQVMGGLADAFHDFNAGEASSVVLSGNIAGAALTLLPVALDLFGISSGPDPNEVILEQIHALSQQMADFQNQVNTRFDRIDEAIDGLFTGVADLGDRIDAVSGTLSQVRDQISDIYDGVVRLQASVQQLQANIYDALRKLTLAEQQEKIDGALGYETRNGVPMPTEKFNDA